MLMTVAAADSASTVRKKYSVSIYIARRNHTLCTLYINRHIHCVFYSIIIIIIMKNSHLFFTEGWKQGLKVSKEAWKRFNPSNLLKQQTSLNNLAGKRKAEDPLLQEAKRARWVTCNLYAAGG